MRTLRSFKKRTCVSVETEKIEDMSHRKKKRCSCKKAKTKLLPNATDRYVYICMQMLAPYDCTFSLPFLRPRLIIMTRNIFCLQVFPDMFDSDRNDAEFEPVLEALVLSLDCVVGVNVVVTLIHPSST